MPDIPLSLQLKKRIHKEIALAQDVLVAQAYESFPRCVLHGGTSVWRCYGGSRFSEDVDVYLPGSFSSKAEDQLRKGLLAKGMVELKFKKTENTVFGNFSLAGAVVSFEAALRRPPGRVLRDYEMLNGGTMLVAALPPEELLVEKVSAYLSRRKVRDLYDVYFLLRSALKDPPDERSSGRSAKVRRSLVALAAGYMSPLDEPQLKALILSGAVPRAEEMIEEVRNWERRST